MAIYRCAVQTISRAAGRSATAAAAYRAGALIIDQERTHDYRRKGGIEHAEVLMPEGTPPLERTALWCSAEAAEHRRNATVAREVLVALPTELDQSARRDLAVRMGRWLADTYSVAADVCVHAPHRGGDDRNHHAHIMLTTRRIGHDGQLGKKTRELDDRSTGPAEIRRIREQWEQLCNQALERAGRQERVSCRTLKAQGIDRKPQVRLGPAATALLRRGIAEDGGVARAKAEYNQAQRNAPAVAAKPQQPPRPGLLSRIAASLNQMFADVFDFGDTEPIKFKWPEQPTEPPQTAPERREDRRPTKSPSLAYKANDRPVKRETEQEKLTRRKREHEERIKEYWKNQAPAPKRDEGLER